MPVERKKQGLFCPVHLCFHNSYEPLLSTHSSMSDNAKRVFELSLKTAPSSKRPRLADNRIHQISSEEERDSFKRNHEVVQTICSIADGKIEAPDATTDPRVLVVPLVGEVPSDGANKGTLLAALQRNKEQNPSIDAKTIDLANHAADLGVNSSAYNNVPVEEFGAALLRGMGWTGATTDDQKSSYKEIQPRKKGLGLGASISNANTNGNRRQRQLEVNDIVRTEVSGHVCRALIVQSSGVPGLNKVRIQCEKDGRIVDVDRGTITLVSSQELEDRPFVAPLIERKPYSHQKDMGERRGTDLVPEGAKPTIPQNGHHQPVVREAESGHDSRRRGWLFHGIRVKIVSKKVGGSALYLQKGVVEDIPLPGLALVKCGANGQVVEVKEKYLETVLPRTGEACMVLSGSHRGQRATFVERNDAKSRASVQLSESYEIISIDYDSIAGISS